MVLRLGVFGDAADGVDAVQERRKLHRAPQAPSARSQPSSTAAAASTCSSVRDSHHPTVYRHPMAVQIVVAGALIRDGMLLVAQRDRPPELAGRWELPGGKSAAGKATATRWCASCARNWAWASRSATGWATTSR